MANHAPPRPPLPASLQEHLQTWRQAHPNATFAEMEEGVSQMLNALRPQMLAHLAEAALTEPPLCARCGKRMQRRGNRKREVVTEGDEVLTLERPYWTCPRCALGLFPPG